MACLLLPSGCISLCGIYEGERRVVCDLCHIFALWTLILRAKGLSDYGRSNRRELRRRCDGRHSAANTTNGTPVTGVPRPSIIPSTDTLHAFHHVGVSSHGPLDGHNNGADLRCNSWFGKEITQKCDQSGQRDSSEQRQPATSILRHHSMAEVDLEPSWLRLTWNAHRRKRPK